MDFWTYYWGFVSFVFGAVVGSFLNVCIWRLPRNESLVHPPSHCPHCNHRLAFLPDMVPLLSQLWYRSRCRHCGTPFSWRYFWVELLTAVTFTAVYARYSVFGAPELGPFERTASTICGMVFVAALITIFFIDLEFYVIANSTILVAVAAALVKDGILIWKEARPLWQQIPGTSFSLPLPLSVLGGLLAFWLLWQFAALGTAALGKEAMGAGDAYLLGAMAAFLIPWPLVALAFLCSVALGTVGGLLNLWLADRYASSAKLQIRNSKFQSLEAEGLPGDDLATPEDSVSHAVASSDGSDGADRVDRAEGADHPHVAAGWRHGALGGPEDDSDDGDADEERPMPACPPESRWGRVWTVLGTWVALGAVWGGAVLFESNHVAGIAAGVVGLAAAAGLLAYGIRLWKSGDGAGEAGGWQEAMDEYFEEDPGPRTIAFGPYLVAGTLIAMFFGQQIIAWYATAPWGLSLPLQELRALPWD